MQCWWWALVDPLHRFGIFIEIMGKMFFLQWFVANLWFSGGVCNPWNAPCRTVPPNLQEMGREWEEYGKTLLFFGWFFMLMWVLRLSQSFPWGAGIQEHKSFLNQDIQTLQILMFNTKSMELLIFMFWFFFYLRWSCLATVSRAPWATRSSVGKGSWRWKEDKL